MEKSDFSKSLKWEDPRRWAPFKDNLFQILRAVTEKALSPTGRENDGVKKFQQNFLCNEKDFEMERSLIGREESSLKTLDTFKYCGKNSRKSVLPLRFW